MLYSEIIAVSYEIHTRHTNTLCGQNVPRSKHSVSVTKTSQLMLYIEIIAVSKQFLRCNEIVCLAREYFSMETQQNSRQTDRQKLF
jgi:hypothetical protein